MKSVTKAMLSCDYVTVDTLVLYDKPTDCRHYVSFGPQETCYLQVRLEKKIDRRIVEIPE